MESSEAHRSLVAQPAKLSSPLVAAFEDDD